MDVEPDIASNDRSPPAWGGGGGDAAVETTIRADLRTEAEGACVSIRRELRRGDEVLAEHVAWRRMVVDGSEDDLFDAIGSLGAGLAFACEAADALPPGYVDALLDGLIEKAVARRREEEAEAAEALAEAEREERASREIHVFFRGDGKKPSVEMKRGDQKAFFKLRFGAEWERERFWDWLKWQTDRYDTFERQVADLGIEPVRTMLLNEMLVTEQRVKKLGLGAGGRRPLIFWRGG